MAERGGTRETMVARGGSGAYERTIAAGDISPPLRDPEGPLARGDVVGRYVILDKLGAGGMGVVYAAYDPELDRKVALKVVLPSAGEAASGPEGHTRLLREAQALARLSHPNVVAVHDVGTVDARVWIAMEFVEGRTLGAWKREQPRTWRDILDVMTRAGQGLAAAHRADLLHRDFKPDNVMVGEDGRVRVMDFGLARAGRNDPGERGADVAEVAQGRPIALTGDITPDGAIMGTPAYMSPEQFKGQQVTAAADQFAYCVTLWEMLFDERPFAGDTLMALAAAVSEGELRTPPRAGVPAWLRRVCARGLGRSPSRRHPSIDALLEALESGQRRTRRGRVVGALATVALLGASAEGYRRHDRTRAVEACEQTGREITTVWNDGTRARVHDAIATSGIADAALAAEKSLPWLDAHAQAWSAARTGACVAHEVEGAWSEDTERRALWCLDERRRDFTAVVDALAHADKVLARRAVTAAAGLPRVEPCSDADLLHRLGAPPNSELDAIHEVQDMLSRASAMTLAAQYAEGLELAMTASARARELAWPPLLAHALLHVGRLQEKSGEYDLALATLRDTYFKAAAAGASRVAIKAANLLVLIVGQRKSTPMRELVWDRTSALELDRLGAGEHDFLRAELRANLSVVAMVSGEYAEAERLLERNVITNELLLGADHPATTGTLNDLASIKYSLGSYEEAKTMYRRVIELRTRHFGPNHPSVAECMNNLAIALGTTGEHDEARTTLGRVLAIYEEVFGPDHPVVGSVLNNIGLIAQQAGDNAGALEAYERALTLWKARAGPDDPNIARVMDNIGITALETDDYGRARALHQQALEIRERVLGPDHTETANSALGLGNAYIALGDGANGGALIERAASVYERALGPDHPDFAKCLVGMARAARLEQRSQDAVALGERALAINVAKDTGDQLELARYQLARSLHAAGRERPRALALAEQAAAAFRGDPGKAKVFRDITSWIDARARE